METTTLEKKISHSWKRYARAQVALANHIFNLSGQEFALEDISGLTRKEISQSFGVESIVFWEEYNEALSEMAEALDK